MVTNKIFHSQFRTIRTSWRVLAAACLLGSASIASADTVYVLLDGIPGESQEKAFSGQIRAENWSFGAANTGNLHLGAASGAGRAAISDITFTHRVGIASPKLLEAAVSGKHIQQARITVARPVSGMGNVPVLIIDLMNVRVSSVSDSGGEGGPSMQSVSLSFAAFNYAYRPIPAPGAKQMGPIEFGWNVAANAPL